jgi:hypothetical protein
LCLRGSIIASGPLRGCGQPWVALVFRIYLGGRFRGKSEEGRKIYGCRREGAQYSEPNLH